MGEVLSMRILVVVMALLCLGSLPAFSKGTTSFDDFIESREVVATLYFQPNNDNLTKSEQARLSSTIDKLRELQKNGRMIRVEGFSSPEGDQENNFRLSFFRARAVADLIEAKGLPAEVTLTGYGDLKANSSDHSKERRVEIASYLKPVGMQRVKVAADKNRIQAEPVVDAADFDREEMDIDAYRVEQAIRKKIDDKNKGLADKEKAPDDGSTPGLSQSEEKNKQKELDRGYSQWRKSVDPNYSPKLSQSEEAAKKDIQRGYSRAVEATDKDLQRGYSQWKKVDDPETSPGVTQVGPAESQFIIDALMIEQAIMEKVGTDPPVPSGSVSQADAKY